MTEENEVDPINGRLARIESDIGLLKSDVSLLKSDIGLLKSDVSLLKGDVGLLKSDVAWLKHLYRSLDYRVWFILGGVIITILAGFLR